MKQPEISPNAYKYQVSLMNLITIKERLDALTQSIRSFDQESKSKSAELDALRGQLGSAGDKEPAIDFSQLMRQLRKCDDSQFQQLKGSLRDEQVSQLLFSLSVVCRTKRIFELPFSEVCRRLEVAFTQ